MSDVFLEVCLLQWTMSLCTTFWIVLVPFWNPCVVEFICMSLASLVRWVSTGWLRAGFEPRGPGLSLGEDAEQ